MKEASRLVIVASKEELNKIGLALGEADCIKHCEGVSFPNECLVTDYARYSASQHGYEIVALSNKRKTFSGLKFDVDVEFYNMPEDKGVSF